MRNQTDEFVRRLAAVALSLVAMMMTQPVVVAAAAGAVPETSTWLVVADNTVSFDARTALSSTGGSVTRSIPQIGVFVISGDGTLVLQTDSIPHAKVVRIRSEFRAPDAPHGTPVGVSQPVLPSDDDFYFPGQWALQAIKAPLAWTIGQRGQGVRVAVLDTGVDPTHPDLAANVNAALATSFVPGQTWDVSTDAMQDFDHGTHIAGIIAAADNGFGIIGVAPRAEIVPVQVLRRPSGTGPIEAVIQGIVYAADAGAHVINLSLGYVRVRHGGINNLGTPDPGDDVAYTAQEAATLMAAFARATEYAHARGSTIVAAAHNNTVDADHDRDSFILPRDAPHVVSVAATGPLGWALDPGTDLDRPAFYTNYGQSVIDLSAPGGNLDFDLLASGAVCTVNSGAVSITLPCWLFDGVLSTAPVKGGFLFEFRRGTSMAAAHVSGVAALIVGSKTGGVTPDQVLARLRATADDLGKAGKDDFYGLGRVNAYQAVQ